MTATTFGHIDEQEYRRRIRAWMLYDWANSAFATTIMAAVLPVYYSQVAGAAILGAARLHRGSTRFGDGNRMYGLFRKPLR